MRPTIALWAAVLFLGLQLSASFPDSIVDRSSQNLTSVPGDLPHTTESLDLSCNHIQKLHRGDFRNTPLLRFLNISWNSLEEIDPETFLDTPLLEDLDLSHNRLKNLSDQRYLLHADNLLVLNLACNKFLTMTLGSEFSSLVKLERLALGAKNISVGDFKNIAEVKLHTLTLSLEDNVGYEAGSLKDVHAQKLQIALTRNQKIDHDLLADGLSLFVELELINLIKGYEDLSNQLKARKEIYTSSLYLTNISIKWTHLTYFVNVVLNTSIAHLYATDVVLNELPQRDTDVVRATTTILCPAVAIALLIMILCHRLDVPWYMRMIWKWTRAKHRARMRQVRPEDLVGIEFHAFVSYSQHDADWVHNSLIPNLEGPSGGLRICHHEKHFVAGKTIIENIITSVEKSRRSLFVLSAHFVKSEWCHYELYFASHQRLAQGSDSVVLVLLEPLPQYLIPSKYYQLKSMMSRHTYIEWPQDRAKHRLFWANLRAALQADLPNAPVTELED
ncbi:Toll-like receptor 6 [Nibea albiflora]|uniref:Toll-like receptor 6 n=1 Tax=Nibea albiflora TaxID=240163 RepID=A0ACB7EQC6_NIBAL|nr:Toll-like receptor 6 [Nibea albiflora]